MTKIPTLIAYLFIGLTLNRVADYVDNIFHSAGWSWVFSIGLGASVFISSYFTRKTQQEEKTPARNRRRAAWVSLAFFVAADGFFNLAEVFRTAEKLTGWQSIGVWIYGLFPTIAALLMGLLQGYIDREKNTHKPFSLKGFVRSLRSGRFAQTWLVELLSAAQSGSEPEPATLSEKPADEKPAEQPLSDVPCKYAGAGCERTFATTNAANAHARSCEFKPTTVYTDLIKEEVKS